MWPHYSGNVPLVKDIKSFGQSGKASVVCTVNEDLRRVSIALLGFVLHLAGQVTQQATHAQSADFFRAICKVNQDGKLSAARDDDAINEVSHTL